MTKRIRFLCCLTPLLLAAACGRAPEKDDAASGPKVEGETIQFARQSRELAEVRVEKASEAGAASFSLTGRLGWNEDRTTRLTPPVAGRIVRLAASVGERVAKGALLAELSSPDFGQAQSDAARAAADVSVAERSRERIAALYERGAAARKDLDAAESDLVRARAEAQRSAARLARWGGDLLSAPDQLYRMRSPIAGVVVERNANPGLEVRPDSPNPVFVVSDPSTLWVFLDLSERDLAEIAAGDRLRVRSGAYPRRIFDSRLDVVGDALDPATRMVKARGTVENPDGSLKAEMYVSVEAASRGAREAVVVPSRAVLVEGERRFCFVEDGPARFKRVPVSVGVEREGKVPVSGLSSGARVVTEGGLLLSSLLDSRSDRGPQ